MSLQTIPLSRLVPSPRNVRKTGGMSVPELAASIRATGLLQNLVVRAKGDVFEVDAGGRRLKALQLLANEGDLAPDFPVPCNVLEAGESIEASLHENVAREAMHPADAFEAFAQLVAQGMSPPEIAARFGYPERTVQQRLKLSKVAPDLIKAYREGKLELQALEAFAVTDDHAAQLAFWKRAQRDTWLLRRPDEIREQLTAKEYPSSAPLAQFVTVKAYEAAGGAVRTDLFASKDDPAAYLVDVQLLERLANEKLQAKAEAIREEEGWSWAEARASFEYDDEHKSKLGRIGHRHSPLGAKAFSKDQKASAGVIVTISRGGVEVHRGMIKPADAAAAKKASAQASKRGDAKVTTKPKAKPKDMSDALRARLTAARTMGLRAEMVKHQHVALVALAHSLAMQLLWKPSANGYFSIGEHSPLTIAGPHQFQDRQSLDRFDDQIEKSPAGVAVRAEVDALRKAMPAKREELFAWLLKQTPATVARVLTCCAALATNAVVHTDQGAKNERAKVVDQMHTAAELDMAAYWKPTVDNYLGSVSKDKVLEALKEANLGDATLVPRLVSAKKAAAAAQAEKLLAGRKWLPRILRAPDERKPAKSAKAKASKKPAKAK